MRLTIVKLLQVFFLQWFQILIGRFFSYFPTLVVSHKSITITYIIQTNFGGPNLPIECGILKRYFYSGRINFSAMLCKNSCIIWRRNEKKYHTKTMKGGNRSIQECSYLFAVNILVLCLFFFFFLSFLLILVLVQCLLSIIAAYRRPAYSCQ